MGDVGATAARSVLLVHADVLIGYLQSDLATLGLVAKHVGRVVVLESVIDEVRRLTAKQCRCVGITMATAETVRMFQAAAVESNVSFNDGLCLVTCREERWTCVTNDRVLRRLCRRHGVATRCGLGLMVDLVAAGVLSYQRAAAIALSAQASDPLHIDERVLNRFVARCHEAFSRQR